MFANTRSTLHVLLCPNAYKGSLTAGEAATAMEAGLQQASSDSLEFVTRRLPLADGGDGTLETLVDATGGQIHACTVSGPLGDPITARWGRLGGDRNETAVIEMAEASGLRLLPKERHDPEQTSTLGVGQLMLEACRAGCTTLLVGIGGSATNDGGAGMATALGARLLDASGDLIQPRGGDLHRLNRIDMSKWKLPAGVTVLAVCDVDNPLTGANGASAVYGPQKGASREAVTRLDAALAHFAAIMKRDLNADVMYLPGAGAAGGLGAGLTAFCGAQLRPGSQLILDAVDFDLALSYADIVITGEGKLDSQTLHGKVIAEACRRASLSGKPCIAIAGSIEPGCEESLRLAGLHAAISLVDAPMGLEQAMANASQLMCTAAHRAGMLLKIGVGLKQTARL